MSVRPYSLVQYNWTAAQRAARSHIEVNASPDSDPVSTIGSRTKGFNTNSRRWLHITTELGDAGTGADFELWLWDDVAELWTLDTRLGTLGTVTLAQADGAYHTIVEIAHTTRVWVKLDNATGTWSGDADKGATVWLSSSGE